MINSIFTKAKKSVDGVMAAFHIAIADLKEVQDRETAAADQHRADAMNSTSLAADALTEAKRAANVSAKLEALVAA